MAPSPEIASFQEALAGAKQVAILTGAGLSAGSGIPTYRGAGGVWNTVDQKLATVGGFEEDPVRVWRFHHTKRRWCLKASPNAAHKALAALHADPSTRAKVLPSLKNAAQAPLFITQNIDNISPTLLSAYHTNGTLDKDEYDETKQRLIEMHGNIFKQQCTQCKHVSTSTDVDLAWLEGSLVGPEPDQETITKDQLPRCGGPTWNGSNRYGRCGGLLRPSVVWFGEIPDGLGDIGRYLNWTDFLIIVGTSALVHPAAGFQKTVKDRGGKVAVFNLDPSPADANADWVFYGKCEEFLPTALGIEV